MSQEKIGLFILRLGLAAVYIYFGISQLNNANAWSSTVPDWALSISGVSAVAIVMFNAIFEIVFASLLALGFWTRIVSILLAIHLAIITFTMGFNPIGVRDFGLTMATLAHAFLVSDKK